MEIFSETMQEKLVDEIVKLAEKLAIEKLQHSKKRYLMQKEVLKEYHMSHQELKRLEMLGLPKRKQGKSWYYDIKDIEKLLDKMKI